jgi:ribosomal protein S18 acetylase RimI-like enzyme
MATMDEVRIVPTGEHYAERFNAAVGTVARERRYIIFLDGPSLESTREFVRSIVGGAGVQMLAVGTTDAVVGWCDVMRNPHEGFRHVGHLGMAFLPGYRGRGFGRRIIAQTIHAAHQIGIERVELEVFASNGRALAFYEAAGFVIEGIRKHARKLDGQYDDIVFMALMTAPIRNFDTLAP